MFVGGHAFYPPSRRGGMVYNQPTLDTGLLDTLRKYVQWVYVNDDDLPNPWDTLPSYLGELFAAVSLNETTGGGFTPAALTKVDDTNVTLTLGGTPATALLQASSITAGWTGTLSIARGGNATTTGISAAAQAALDGKASTTHNHDAAYAPLAHVGTGAAAHLAVTTSVNGFMIAADKAKLDGVATGATAYVHPTGDGNLHVLATSTTNNGKVLTAGPTAGSLSWTTPAPANAIALVSDSAPSSPATGQLWFDSNHGALFIFYDSFWVQLGAIT
jgi:hypothetical protein